MSEINANCILIHSACVEYCVCSERLHRLSVELDCEASRISEMGKDFAPVARKLKQVVDTLRGKSRKLDRLTDALSEILDCYEISDRRAEEGIRCINWADMLTPIPVDPERFRMLGPEDGEVPGPRFTLNLDFETEQKQEHVSGETAGSDNLISGAESFIYVDNISTKPKPSPQEQAEEYMGKRIAEMFDTAAAAESARAETGREGAATSATVAGTAGTGGMASAAAVGGMARKPDDREAHSGAYVHITEPGSSPVIPGNEIRFGDNPVFARDEADILIDIRERQRENFNDFDPFDIEEET